MSDTFGSDPTSQYEADLTAAQSSNNAFQSIAGQLGGSAALQAGLGSQQIATAEANYGLQNASTALQNQYNTSLAGYQLGQLGVSGQQLGLQGLGLQEQQQLLGVQTGVEQAQYGLQQQVFPEEQAEAALNYQNQQENLVGGLAAQGALNTKGSGMQQNLLAQNYAWQSADITRAQEMAQLGQVATGAGQVYSQEELQNAQQNLSLLAQSNGMSQQEVYNQLEYMAASGQLGNQQNAISLLGTLGQINAGTLSGIEGDVSLAGFASGLNLFGG